MSDKVRELLSRVPVAINLGLRGFAESLEAQDVTVLQVDWMPPAGGDREMIDLLDNLTIDLLQERVTSPRPSPLRAVPRHLGLSSLRRAGSNGEGSQGFEPSPLRRGWPQAG